MDKTRVEFSYDTVNIPFQWNFLDLGRQKTVFVWEINVFSQLVAKGTNFFNLLSKRAGFFRTFTLKKE